MGYCKGYHRRDPKNHHQLPPGNLAERDALHHNNYREECLALRVQQTQPRQEVREGNKMGVNFLTVELAVAKSVFSKKIWQAHETQQRGVGK
jgi:hypothetical protein